VATQIANISLGVILKPTRHDAGAEESCLLCITNSLIYTQNAYASKQISFYYVYKWKFLAWLICIEEFRQSKPLSSTFGRWK
jgi:hypothetical protein